MNQKMTALGPLFVGNIPFNTGGFSKKSAFENPIVWSLLLVSSFLTIGSYAEYL